MTAVPPRPAVPDATAGDGLRSAIAEAICDSEQIFGADYWDQADAVLALPALRDVLAAAARDAEAVARVRELAADYDDGSEWGAALYRGDVVRNQIRRALDPS